MTPTKFWSHGTPVTRMRGPGPRRLIDGKVFEQPEAGELMMRVLEPAQRERVSDSGLTVFAGTGTMAQAVAS